MINDQCREAFGLEVARRRILWPASECRADVRFTSDGQGTSRDLAALYVLEMSNIMFTDSECWLAI